MFNNYRKSNKEFNALIVKKVQKFLKKQEKEKTEKELQHFQDMQIFISESKKSVSVRISSWLLFDWPTLI